MLEGIVRWSCGVGGYLIYCTTGSGSAGSILFRQFPDILPVDEFYRDACCLPDNSIGNRFIGGSAIAETSDYGGAWDAYFLGMDKKSAILKPGSQIISMADSIGVYYNY